MPSTPAATSVQLTRAEKIRRTLIGNGWTSSREPRDKHPGAVAAIRHQRLNHEVLILTLGGAHGQIVEITADTVAAVRTDGARKIRDITPSWRLTAYDPPVAATLAAIEALHDRQRYPAALTGAGWDVEYIPAPDRPAGSARPAHATCFTRPDGVVRATFCYPTYTPPCESCPHARDLGDIGGWLITGPGFTAEASTHTPSAVITAFATSLPGGGAKTPGPGRQTQPLLPPRPPEAIARHRHGPNADGIGTVARPSDGIAKRGPEVS